MKVIRDCGDMWNKFGWYQPQYSQDSTKVKQWHIMQSSNWVPPLPRTSIQRKTDFRKKHKASVFNVVKHFDDSVIVWNTASEAVVIITNAEYIELKAFLEKQSISNTKLIQDLYDMGVICECFEDELFKIDYIRKRSIYNTDNVKSFIIIPTTKCNARCFYCFADEDTKTQKTMSPGIISDVVKFIVSQVRPHDEIVYRWFGGEPLMAEHVIDSIIYGVQELIPSITYHSIITTNSSLITDKMLEKAVNHWHLRKMQIPVDGYKITHERRKHYLHGGVNHYEMVIEVIDKLLEYGVYTTCRVNLDMSNLKDLSCILDDFSEFNHKKNFYLQTIPLHTPKNTPNMKEYVGASTYHYFYETVYKLLFQKGFLTDINRLLPRRNYSVCTAMLNNFFLVNADGNLFRCDQERHIPQNSVGSCRSGIVHNNNLRKWLDDSLADECTKCNFLPICQGGCKFYRFRNDPNLPPCVEHKFISDILLDVVYKKYKSGDY